MVMKTLKNLILLMALIQLGGLVAAQSYFRSGIFLHHSTGQNIWGPNGSSTSVPQEMNIYNAAHGFAGAEAVTMNEEWWSPDDNEWARWHAFFENPEPSTGIGQYLAGNPVIVIKSCFPSSAIAWQGSPQDTLDPEMKTIYNYQWHWRHIVRVMRQHPENFFVIWTNAPLEPSSTNATEAALSNQFCTWAKETLASGLDPETGAFPPNVYVFDFFHMLTGSNGMMLPSYAAGPGDSHPNAAATALVAPRFVNEIFDAAIAYETVYGLPVNTATTTASIEAWPNPATTHALIRFTLQGSGPAVLKLFDNRGVAIRTQWEGHAQGPQAVHLNTGDLAPGIYLVRFFAGAVTATSKLVVIR